MKKRHVRIISLLLTLCMAFALAPAAAFADGETTMTLKKFLEAVEDAGGSYDGKGTTVVEWQPDEAELKVDRVQSNNAQYQIFKDLQDVTISNVSFKYIPGDILNHTDAWNGTAPKDFYAKDIQNGELQFQNAGNVTITNCTFDQVIVSPYGQDGGRPASDAGRTFTFTGCTIPSMARTLEGLGADAIGLNCSLGPDLLLPLVKELCESTRLPVIAKPNAGLPDPVDGHYHMDPEAFAQALLPCWEAGVTIFGGCCGTTPDYIRRVREALAGKSPVRRAYRPVSFLCTPTVPLPIDGVRTIGERINPTGKKRFQQALLEGDLDYILDVGIQEVDAGADILDVNVGYPGVDEVDMLPRVVKKLQSALDVPLQLDSSNPAALEAGLRVYNGKAAVNSVNGDPAVQEQILPIVKKYGAAVVGLALDERGIPQTAQERVDIARRILEAALAHGIPKEDVWIDCLTLTVSAQQGQARETLSALRAVREELGLQTVLGVSNISFGLPNRALVTETFLVQALEAGLTLPILNPNQKTMMDAVAAFRVLSGEDEGCRDYVARFAGETAPAASAAPAADTGMTLEDAVIRGLRADAARLAKQALETEEPLSLVNNRLIPALDTVGSGYEGGTLFLPQLLSAAQAAQAVFEVLKDALARTGGGMESKGALAVATVRGDIHDIGKNIVKTVLENYGYQVIDLGRDVPPQAICDAVAERHIPLVGLSALMTTTLPAMEETIRMLKALPEPPAVFVGGAVVTPEYAQRMGADYYAKDARQSVEIAREVLGA